jgi:dTDP-4-amino-4,6-dideoxygalactose transaminase
VDHKRDQIIAAINAAGIWCQVGSCSEIYLEEAFVKAGWAPKTRFHNAKLLGETGLALLVDPHYSAPHIEEAAEKIRVILSAL